MIVFCLHMCIYTTCVQGLQRPGEWVNPLDCSYMRLWAVIWCLGLSLEPITEQQVLFTTQPSLHPFLPFPSLAVTQARTSLCSYWSHNKISSIYSTVEVLFTHYIFITLGYFCCCCLLLVRVSLYSSDNLEPSLYRLVWHWTPGNPPASTF